MSQLREGSLGRLSSQLGGIPVYRSAVRKPLGRFVGDVAATGDGVEGKG